MAGETTPATDSSSTATTAELTPTKNIAKVKYNFTITQIIGIGSFIGTAIVTIGYAFYSYLSNVEEVKKLNVSDQELRGKIVRIDSSINKQSGEIQTLKDLFQKSK